MQPNYEVEMRLNVRTPMRDGVELSSDIYLPRGEGKFPAVLMRTPYDNNGEAMIEKGRRLANNGYACVIERTKTTPMNRTPASADARVAPEP